MPIRSALCAHLLHVCSCPLPLLPRQTQSKHYVRINSARPPIGQPQWKPFRRTKSLTNGSFALKYSQLISKAAIAYTEAGDGSAQQQAQCAEIEECRRFYRAHSSLYFGQAELCAALRPYVPAAMATSSICYQVNSTDHAARNQSEI